MRAPAPLLGGRLGVFAPSSPFPRERFDPGLAALRELGFDPIEHRDAARREGYLAGDDATRLASLHELLADPTIDGLIAARGGYGLHRIVDRIDVDLLARTDKPIVGFSDLTALHALAQSHDRITIHGPVVTQLGELGPVDREMLARILSGRWDGIAYESDGRAIRGGVATGIVLGGCLSVLVHMVGSKLLPSLEGAILLLEDVGEATYRIDRMLTHLKLAGLLAGLAGVAAGDFAGCLPRKDGEPEIDAVLEDRLGDLGIPVLTGLPFGHGRRNLAVPLGARATLDADRRRLVLHGDAAR